MHGRIPRDRHAHQVMAAIFDATTRDRIEDARVEALVSPLGLASATRSLTPMVIAGTITYGNYSTLEGCGLYRIRTWQSRCRRHVTSLPWNSRIGSIHLSAVTRRCRCIWWWIEAHWHPEPNFRHILTGEEPRSRSRRARSGLLRLAICSHE